MCFSFRIFLPIAVATLPLLAVCPPQGHLYTVPIREQGNIYKPNNKAMADEVIEKQVYDAHTKEIDLVNRDPKHLNDDVVKVRGGCWRGRAEPRAVSGRTARPWPAVGLL